MAEQSVIRRLAAILSADMVGYSRLMETDEEGIVARQRIHRAELIDPKIAEHHGRIVKTTGDGLLVEFASAVDAVRCAIEVQRAMSEREAGVSDDRRIQYRTGINLGDVIVDGDDILGDGVNVAARLQESAEAGGISISRAIHDQIYGKLNLLLKDLGEVEVKNISRPIHIFQVLLDDGPAPGEAVLLSADARGFALLMGDVDEQAHADLAHCHSLFSDQIESHHGRLMDGPGDGIRASFARAGDALACAIDAQAGLAAWNLGLPAVRRLRFRIGIAGVVAAEMEARAEPGGVCVGPEVHDALASESSYAFEGIAMEGEAPTAFKVVLPPAAALPSGGHPAPQCQALDLPLPTKPSIMLMPFKNLSGDPEQEHIVQGIRIDVHTAVSKISGLVVIANGPAMTYKAREVAPEQVGREMGIHYILEGAIQKSGERVRINAQLIETESGKSVWSEHYDCVFDDTFAVQDEIIEKIVTAMDVKLVAGEQARVWRKTLRDPKALELLYRGFDYLFRMDKESMAIARQYFEAVADMTPKVAMGPTFVAFSHWWDAVRGWSKSAEVSLNSAGEWAEKATALEDPDGQGHIILAHVHLMKRRHDEALRVAEEAVRIRPGCANTNALYGNILLYCGRPREAIGRIKNGIRFSPVYAPWWVNILAAAYRDSQQHGLAISAAKEALRLNPGDRDAHVILASACAASGWMDVAREIAGTIVESDPDFALSSYTTTQPYSDPETLAKIVADLRTAGLPD